jgi:hypothetical protein
MSSAPGDKNCGTPRCWSGSSAQTAASPTTLRGAFFWCWSTKSCRGGKSHSPSSSVWSKQQCQALTGSRPISKLGRPSHTLHSVGHSHEQQLHRGRNRLCDSLSEPAASHPQLLNRRHLHGNVSCSIALICALLRLTRTAASSAPQGSGDRTSTAPHRPNWSETPKRDCYCQSRRGNRLFELGLGEVALAFTAASSKADQAAIADVLAAHGRAGFAAAWLRRKGLDWAAELLEPAAPPNATTLSKEAHS